MSFVIWRPARVHLQVLDIGHSYRTRCHCTLHQFGATAGKHLQCYQRDLQRDQRDHLEPLTGQNEGLCCQALRAA